MKPAIAPMLFAAFIWTSSQAADDPGTPASAMSHQQMMKDCMAKQKERDSTVSKEDMKAACKSQMTAQKKTTDQSMQTKPEDPTTDKNIGTATSSQK